MAWFVSLLGALYASTLVVIIPISIAALWDLAFAPGGTRSAIGKLIVFSIWTVVGFLVLWLLVYWRREKVKARINSVAPPGFKPMVEFYGLHDISYFGISPLTDQLVVVDMRRKVARCERMSFLQEWVIEEVGSRTAITISFNSLDFSTIKMRIAPNSMRDLAAKLNYALSL